MHVINGHSPQVRLHLWMDAIVFVAVESCFAVTRYISTSTFHENYHHVDGSIIASVVPAPG